MSSEGLEVTKTPKANGAVEVAVTFGTGYIRLEGRSKDGIPVVGIRDEATLRKFAGLPEDRWDCTSLRPNSWVQQTKDPRFSDGESPAVFLACQIRGTFTPKTDSELSARELLDSLKGRSPIRKARKRKPLEDDAYLLEVSIPDLHLGMRTWEEETGNAYDLDIAADLFLGSIETFIEKSKHMPVEEVLFPIGNDFMHIDNPQLTTTAGTFQAEAESYQRTFSAGRDLLVQAILRLSDVAPVTVLSIPGNHDKHTSICMAHVIDAYFHADENVTVDCTARHQKRHVYGDNLLAFDHGKNIKPVAYAALMAELWPEEFAKARFREWHLGDQHRKGGVWFSECPVTVEFIPSLCGVNSWHAKKGHRSPGRAAYAYLWGRTGGLSDRYQVNVCPGESELAA